ncbi:MAG: hypothetical protein A2Z88_07595 [Omnitrophica WOR_2 bacterium GWA2_47_8]|nr:MAG: hypothetical protein A2Z88_07595 [Omnitrophica WOR_2 bacterium GWA2_47_8]
MFSPDLTSKYKKEILAAVLLFVVPFLLYGPKLNNEFFIDDHDLIKDIRFYTLKTIPVLFAVGKTEAYHYRPLSSVVRVIQYHFFQDKLVYYRVMQLLVFSLCSLLVFAMLYEIFKNYYAALLAAVIFAMHPLNSLYIFHTGTFEMVWACICLIFSTLYGWRFLQAGGRSYRVLSVALYGAAILFQEINLVFPLYAVLIFYYYHKDLKFAAAWSFVKPYFYLALAYFSFRLFFVEFLSIIGENPRFRTISFPDYTASVIQGVNWLIQKLIYPVDFAFITNLSPASLTGIIFFILGAVVFIAASWKLSQSSRDKVWLVSFLWLVIGFFPIVLAVFIMPDQGLVIETHWFIFSSIGYFLFLALVLGRMAERLPYRLGIVLTVLTVLFILKQAQGYLVFWQSEKQYCENWVRWSPNNRLANFLLGNIYSGEGKTDKAAEFYYKSLSNHAVDVKAYANLALMETMKRNYPKALYFNEKALSFNPRSALVYNNIGIIYYLQNNFAEAKKYFEKAIETEPYLLESRLNLAVIYHAEKRFSEAITLYEDNLKLDPIHEETIDIAIRVYLLTDQAEKADPLAQRLLKQGRQVQVLNNTAGVYAEKKMTGTALALYTRALRLEPKNKDTYLELGKLYGNLNQFDRAIAVWREGMRIDPDEEQFKSLISQAENLKKRGDAKPGV